MNSKWLKKEKIFSKRWFFEYLLIIFGSFIIASSYVLFISPFKIIPGGVYGISIIIHYLTKDIFLSFADGLPIGATALFFNIPLAWASYKILGKSSIWKTITTFFLTAFFVDLITYWNGLKPIVENDALLSSIYGGVILGIGVGLIFKAYSTSAGTDVIAKIIAKYFHLQVGNTIIIVDSIIVLIGLIAFADWRIPLYSWITIFIFGKVVDIILQGFSFDKAVFIISEKNQIISDVIINELNRGGTYLKGKGMYNNSEKEIILTVINYRELPLLKKYIYEIDPNAFLTIINATEIVGKGFKSFEEKNR